MKKSAERCNVAEDFMVLRSLKWRVENVLSKNIFEYWFANIYDDNGNGFAGAIENSGIKVSDAPKGLVFYTRILWAMSRGYGSYRDVRMKNIADVAYEYICEHFHDKEHGGFFWELDCMGNVVNPRKSIYGQAFAIYGLSEYARVFSSDDAVSLAMDTFGLIELHARDYEYNGYIETLSVEWGAVDDMRLSTIDMNVEKSNNTHLHLMEAYTNLFDVTHDGNVCAALKNSIEIMTDFILDQETGNFRLFFNRKWEVESNVVSCGHEIEAAWLIDRAIDVLGDEDLFVQKREIISGIAGNCMKYLENDIPLTGMNNEISGNGIVDRNKIWWVQAEACVGFFNEYQKTSDIKYLFSVVEIWSFIERYIVDNENGEWLWYAADPTTSEKQIRKIDMWKSCYHNVRACIELLERIDDYVGGENVNIQ